jgi:hypothetical protein
MITGLSFMLLVQLEVTDICSTLIYPDSSCEEFVTECVYDEGLRQINFCFDAYLEESNEP